VKADVFTKEKVRKIGSKKASCNNHLDLRVGAMFWGVSTTISKIASAQATAQATAQAEHRYELCLLDSPPSPPFANSHSLQLKPLSLAKQAQVTLIVLYPILKDAKQD